MYGFLLAQSLSNMAIGIFTLRQQLRGLLSGNWPNAKTPYVEYLVVGGGGGAGAGGASYGGSGGGAGGVLTGILPVTAGATNNVTIGGGGAGGTAPGNAGSQGVNSVLNSLIAVGGGYGVYSATGGNGGSGGGGGNPSFSGGQGVFGQGNKAGAGNTNRGGVGGGGAGTVSSDSENNSYAIPSTGLNGGAGISSTISGTVTPYGGGGAGGGGNGGTGGTGGVGGGGNGSGDSGVTAGDIGQANTGGGGGGGSNNSSGTVYSAGGAGGSGIVIISYPDNYAALTATGSPTVSTSGSGSISLSSGNYLTSSSSSNLALGTNSFTAEYWVNITNVAVSNQNAVGLGTTNYNPILGYVSTNLVLFLSSNGSSWDIASNVTIGTPTSGTWAHVAIVRNGNTFYTFFNGVQGSTFSNSSSIYQNSNTVLFGTGFGNTLPFTGYVSNFRLLNGTALYTSNFTPPTAPLTAITNTQALFNCVSGAPFTDSSANSLTATVVGTPTWNQSSPFATGLGYKNRVYSWTTTGSGTFTV